MDKYKLTTNTGGNYISALKYMITAALADARADPEVATFVEAAFAEVAVGDDDDDEIYATAIEIGENNSSNDEIANREIAAASEEMAAFDATED
ncbi:hypothetical protein [Candidatus Epulonipiscium viviparus]|uniref:hypothetical protein n=1 Tax=Candidatus Epulonipiscium viviparus TaxID=420336 RepID=UPI0027381660|nr:hypothetical protein [Candidatus Epulopiscium viviparus]